MPEEQILYSAVLTDLESRRNALKYRISSIDAAMKGLRVILETPVGMEPRALAGGTIVPVYAHQPVLKALPASTQTTKEFTFAAQSASPAARAERADYEKNAGAGSRARAPQSALDRRSPSAALNIYVNPFAEWSRKMSRGNARFRKKAGANCPRCRSADTRKSATRNLSDYFMQLFNYSNARCRNCDYRFRIWHPKPAENLPRVQTAG